MGKQKFLRCPSAIHKPDGLLNAMGIETGLAFSGDEKKILRYLARRQAELAARPEERERIRLWTDLNGLKPTRPLVFCDPENGWNEIIPQDVLLCADPLARVWEMQLRKEIFWAERMGDDRAATDVFNVPMRYHDDDWGLEIKLTGGRNGGAYSWEPPLRDYERDFPKLRLPEMLIDEEMSGRILDLARNLFGDILSVRSHTPWWHALGMTKIYVLLRGLDTFMTDMYDHPEWVHRTMAFLCKGFLGKMDYLEKNGLLWRNHDGTYVGSGGFGWTAELPAEGFDPGHVRLKDMWGFNESQETVGVGPEMFEEFVFPYQVPLMERFGLNCYGCCEPLDSRWHAVKRFPRLRRVSVSAWSNAERMAENLGCGYVYSWKPSPTPLSRPTFDRREMRRSIRSFLEMARAHDCRVEMIMKDNHTLGGNPENPALWCRIAREEAERTA